MVHRWGRAVAVRATYILLVGVALTVAAAVYGSSVFGSLSNGGFTDPDSESARELAVEQRIFGNRGADVIAIYSSPQHAVTDPAFRAAVQRVVAGLPDAPVASVVTFYDTGSPRLLSADRHSTQVIITLSGTDQDAKSRAYEAIVDDLQSGTLRTHVAGPWAVYHDVNQTVSADLKRAEMYSLPIVLALSLVIFGGLVAAAMPVLVGAVAVVGALAVTRLLTLFTDVSVFSINIITLLGMGLAVDYALFMVSRFREELHALPAGHPDAAGVAIRATMNTAGRTVLFSGLTVAAAMSSLLIFPQTFLKSMGYGGIAAVLVAMLAALTVLPAVLRLLGRRIDAGQLPRGLTPRLPRRLTRRNTPTPQRSRWERLAYGVMRRPLTYLVVIVIGLLALGSPFLGVQWGSVDYRVLPADSPAHVAADKLAREFGGPTSTATLLIRDAQPGQVGAYATAVRDVDGVTAVRPVARQGSATLLRAVWQGNSQTPRSQDIVRAIRAVEPPGAASVLVGGMTAATVDLLDSIGAHLPWTGLIVIAVMLVLLLVAFGSVVLPIKAVLMNAVSIVASFGVVTWIFAEGHLEGLLGFESPSYLDATQPILMLAILFGLSMDYEVFLLSRIREQWDRTGDNTRAVATGLARTGRIITSAALLLAIVTGAFATSEIVFMKMIGVGMLVALLLDATVVRALLVPATMKLLGRANWWAPGPLRRWWERHAQGEAPTVDAATDPRATELVRS